MIRISCSLEVSTDGTLARLVASNGLTIATMSVNGPLLRSVMEVKANRDGGANFVLQGLADNQYIDPNGVIRMERERS